MWSEISKQRKSLAEIGSESSGGMQTGTPDLLVIARYHQSVVTSHHQLKEKLHERTVEWIEIWFEVFVQSTNLTRFSVLFQSSDSSKFNSWLDRIFTGPGADNMLASTFWEGDGQLLLLQEDFEGAMAAYRFPLTISGSSFNEFSFGDHSFGLCAVHSCSSSSWIILCERKNLRDGTRRGAKWSSSPLTSISVPVFCSVWYFLITTLVPLLILILA